MEIDLNHSHLCYDRTCSDGRRTKPSNSHGLCLTGTSGSQTTSNTNGGMRRNFSIRAHIDQTQGHHPQTYSTQIVFDEPDVIRIVVEDAIPQCHLGDMKFCMCMVQCVQDSLHPMKNI